MEIEDAAERAEAYLRTVRGTRDDIEFYRDQVVERSWCFVFFWDSKEFFRTGDDMKSLLGNSPIAVSTDGSAVFEVGTHEGTEKLLDDYERRHRISASRQRERALP